MAKKVDVKTKDIYAVMTAHDDGSIVKRWQYYSVFNFCRCYGSSVEEAGQVARWCEKANAGDSRRTNGCLIRIMELEGGYLR